VGGELGVNDLDGHSSIERGVGGKKDHAHAPASQLAFEPVLRPKRRLKCGEEVDGRIAHVRDQWEWSKEYTRSAARPYHLGEVLGNNLDWMLRSPAGLPSSPATSGV
jgi:hypothetical protein